MAYETSRAFKYLDKQLEDRDEVTVDDAKSIVLDRYPNARMDSNRMVRMLKRIGYRRIGYAKYGREDIQCDQSYSELIHERD